MRTGTDTSPKEIVPFQIARGMGTRYPRFGTVEPGKYWFEGGRVPSEKLLHPAGGSTIGAGIAGPKSSRDPGKRLWMLWRGESRNRRKSSSSYVKPPLPVDDRQLTQAKTPSERNLALR